MKISMLAGLALSLVVVGTGCSSSVVRTAATPTEKLAATESVAAAPRLDARLLPGEYEVVYSAPEASHAVSGPITIPTTHPEAASKKGKLLLGDVHTLSMQ